MDENWTLMKEGTLSTPTLNSWICKNLPNGSFVGADPHLVSYSIWSSLSNDLQAAGINLVPVDTNLIDVIWNEKLSPPSGVINPLPIKYSGVYKMNHILMVRVLNTGVY